jgi:hypothetical protein
LRAARRIDPAGASDDVLLLVPALVEVAAFAVPDDHEAVDRVAGVVPDHDDLAVRLEGEVVGEVIAERAGGEVGGVPAETVRNYRTVCYRGGSALAGPALVALRGPP